MPTLKHLRCEIEWGNTKTPFPEYGTTYGDGVVETYIAIPDHPQPFAIHLTSKSYIAEGLSVMVFMDGDYQCNRNRLGLKPRRSGLPRHLTEVDFRLRQKEKPLGDGTYLGRSWRFDKHNVVPVDQFPNKVDRQHFNDLGKICLFVLRCQAKEEIELRSATSSDVDDTALQTRGSTSEQTTEEITPNNSTEPQAAAPVAEAVSEPEEAPQPEAEPDMLLGDTMLGFMNDGATDFCHFGLDGEGPGYAEQKAWSWNPQHPPMPAGPAPSGGHIPGQPPALPTQPYVGYGHSSTFSQPWQPGAAVNQDHPTSNRPERRVHFNDQIRPPPPPATYGATDQQHSGQNVGANIGQPQPQDYLQHPGSYGQLPQGNFPYHPPGHGPPSYGYGNPPLHYSGMSNVQDHGRGISASANLKYPPPIPSYQPVGYGTAGYTGWPPTPIHSVYNQPIWPGQPVHNQSYSPPPHPPPPFQQPYSLPFAQPTYPGYVLAPIPQLASTHPGGGVWGPPPQNPGSQDPARDENNQLDGQGTQNQDTTSNPGGQSTNDNNQGWGNADTNQTQTGDSNWNSNDAGAGQTDNWNNTTGGQTHNWNTATQSGAPNNDWNQSTANTGQTNNADPPWDNNANTSTQVQDAWNNAPAAAQQNDPTPTSPPQGPGSAVLSQDRPLYGPHGPYYTFPQSPADKTLRPDAGEEPPYDVPEDMPTTHQVKPGEGYMYVHKRRSPVYLDTLEEPYAKFVFKYRTKEQIQNETGITVEDEPTGDEEKRKLQSMKKDDIIEMLLRAKIALGGEIPSPPSLPLRPDGYTNNYAEPTALPAPAYSFLSYSVPSAKGTANIPSPGNNAGLGLSVPAPPASAAAGSSTQDWGGNNNWATNSNAGPVITSPAAASNTAQNWGGNSGWVNNTTSPAQASASAPPQQPPATNTWGTSPAAPGPQQQPTTSTWSSAPTPAPLPGQAPAPAPSAPQHKATDSWGLPPGPTPPQPQPQPQPPTQSQPQLQPTQSQPQQAQQLQPPIPPIQFSSNVQTYNPNPQSRPHPQPPPPGTDRPSASPNRGWNAQQPQHTHTAQSSNASDNGMAGWNAGGAGAGAGGGRGWSGSSNAGGGAGGAQGQPEGGW